mmetsp:Transcript_31793/g.90302  ORF Transcript_31793/g.90302 Transcript_31793/m.90302 type:complete len:284 (-) Transcript_31793:453-1304(-)
MPVRGSLSSGSSFSAGIEAFTSPELTASPSAFMGPASSGTAAGEADSGLTIEGSLFLTQGVMKKKSMAAERTPKTTEAVIFPHIGSGLRGLDFRVMSMTMKKTVTPYRRGVTQRTAFMGLALRKTIRSMDKYQTAAITPEPTGEATQEMTMPPKPPSMDQLRQPQSTLPTTVAPTTPPIMAWVVDTGMAVKEQSSRKMEAAKRAQNMAVMYRVILVLQRPQPQQLGSSGEATPLRMVPETPYPRRIAPSQSIMPPVSTAGSRGRAPEPTEVPQELAESLAPMP